jgi:hypothetical protein
MTRFKRELIKRGIAVEETLPYLPYNNIEAINVHADRALVSTYDNRVGWCYEYYDRDMQVNSLEIDGEVVF